MATAPFVSKDLPVRKGGRPKTFVGPLHVQCDGHGDPSYLRKLLDDVLSWPYINPTDGFATLSSSIPILRVGLSARKRLRRGRLLDCEAAETNHKWWKREFPVSRGETVMAWSRFHRKGIS